MSTIRTLQVVIKDFKHLKNLKSEVNGCNVFLRGPNRVGKSSFMDFIEIAFGKSSLVPPNTPIRGHIIADKNGQKYKFDVDLDKKGKVKVTVTMPDGNRDTDKSVIAGIVGANKFDIDRFVNLSLTDKGRKQQVQDFKEFLDEETRSLLEKEEANIQVKFDERTEINRDIVKLDGSIKLDPMFIYLHELDKFEETKTEQVLAELKLVQTNNEKIKKVQSNIEERNKTIDLANEEIAELQSKIDALKINIEQATDLNNQASEWLKTNTIKPTEALEKKISDASEANQKYINAQHLMGEIKKLKDFRIVAEALTKEIEDGREMIRNAIRDMDGPVQGLSFDDEQLLYNGIPVHPSSLSKSEIKKLGIRLKIAENPDLPLFIHEAESMDEESLKEIQDLADECGLQMFAEEVQRSGNRELQIEIVAFSS